MEVELDLEGFFLRFDESIGGGRARRGTNNVRQSMYAGLAGACQEFPISSYRGIEGGSEREARIVHKMSPTEREWK